MSQSKGLDDNVISMVFGPHLILVKLFPFLPLTSLPLASMWSPQTRYWNSILNPCLGQGSQAVRCQGQLGPRHKVQSVAGT